jgi:hypothetical protein
MVIRVSWAKQDQTVIRCDVEGVWTWDEWYAAAQQVVALRSSVHEQAIVPLIVHVCRSRTYPKNGMTHSKRALEMLDERDLVVVVGGGPFVRFLMSTFRELFNKYGERLYMRDTLDEAYQLIAQWREDSAKQ